MSFPKPINPKEHDDIMKLLEYVDKTWKWGEQNHDWRIRMSQIYPDSHILISNFRTLFAFGPHPLEDCEPRELNNNRIDYSRYVEYKYKKYVFPLGWLGASYQKNTDRIQHIYFSNLDRSLYMNISKAIKLVGIDINVFDFDIVNDEYFYEIVRSTEAKRKKEKYRAIFTKAARMLGKDFDIILEKDLIMKSKYNVLF